jgi:hypothetical protein
MLSGRMLVPRIDGQGETFMYAYCCSYLRPLLIGALFSRATPASQTDTHFGPEYGGYLVSADFKIDDKSHAVITPYCDETG